MTNPASITMIIQSGGGGVVEVVVVDVVVVPQVAETVALTGRLCPAGMVPVILRTQ
jgi:hypothetical protein